METVKMKMTNINNEVLLHIGKTLYKLEPTDENMYESFIPISSLITAYARMTLVKYILLVGRENLYYVDTDSLIVNDVGLKNLNSFIDDKKLGYLKVEGESNHSCFYRPKYYIFGNEFKCKGVKKNARVLEDSKDKIVIEQSQFEKFKTSFRKGSINKVNVRQLKKTMSKIYDKGLLNGVNVIPYHIDDLKQ
jgi:hypothetical protein